MQVIVVQYVPQCLAELDPTGLICMDSSGSSGSSGSGCGSYSSAICNTMPGCELDTTGLICMDSSGSRRLTLTGCASYSSAICVQCLAVN